MFRLELQQDVPTPLHIQIRRGIVDAVQSGTLQPAQQLPGVRQLANQLGVNRLTVLKAIRALTSSGLLTSVQGKGVFVATSPPSPAPLSLPSSDPFVTGEGEGPEQLPAPDAPARDALQHAVADGLQPGQLSFAAGFPPPDLLPTATVRTRTTQLLRGANAASLLGYAPVEGLAVLHEALRELLTHRGIQLTDDDCLVVTSGAQQALELCVRALVHPGDALALESPGYMGAIAAARQHRTPLVPIPVDRGGLSPGRLEHALRHHDVGAIYTVPSFQNPTGVTQTVPRRRQLLQLAARYGTLLIEDDIYADLYFGGRPRQPLKSMASDATVVYIGSFSKALAPGLRLGFAVVPRKLSTELLRCKASVDIGTSALLQALLAELLTSGFYRRHTVRARRTYRQRRDAMLTAVAHHMPAWVAATEPKGGLHLWCRPARPFDSLALLEHSRARGVSFAPGAHFFAEHRTTSCFRLNYASHCPATIDAGIERLADSLRTIAGA